MAYVEYTAHRSIESRYPKGCGGERPPREFLLAPNSWPGYHLDSKWPVLLKEVNNDWFLQAVWKWVRLWTRKALEKAGERVADVQGDDNDFEEEQTGEPAVNEPATQTSTRPEQETRETQ